MAEQLNLFGEAVNLQKRSRVDNERRKWENGFQRWSNKSHLKENITEPYGVCGYGSMCDYCEDNTYGRPCVRALNAMCRDKGITLDYTNNDYEQLWTDGCQNRKVDVL